MATAICGLGGVGKTTLAISYAHTKRNDYGYIFWIDADDIVQLDGSYRNIAQHLLSKDTASWEANAIRAAIKEWFASDVSRKDNKPYLIIFDNVDNPAAIYEFVPKTKNGYCLFTSRLQDLRPLVKGNSYQLDVLTPTEAIEYFEKAANLDCNDAQALQEATTLAEELGRLPLALEQAAALIGDMSFTFAEYRRMYQRQHLQLLNQGSLFNDHYKERVATTWNISFERIAKKPIAELLRYCAFLAPDRIPINIFLQNPNGFREPLAQALLQNRSDEVSFKVLCTPATGLSLIHYAVSDKKTDEQSAEGWSTLSMHRLVQEVIVDQLVREQGFENCKTYLSQILEAVAKTYPGWGSRHRAKHNRLSPHWRSCIYNAKLYGVKTVHLARILHYIAKFFDQNAQYTLAEEHYREALLIDERTREKEHFPSAMILHDLAYLLVRTERYSEAEPLYWKTIAIKTNLVGRDAHTTAITLNDFATLLLKQGNLMEAEELYMEALKTKEDRAGSHHVSYAITLHDLASLYVARNHYEQAEILYRRSLKIKIKSVGEEYTETARTLHALGSLLSCQKRYSESEPLYRRALMIEDKTRGREHPYTAMTMYELGKLFYQQGNISEALSLLEEAFAICRRTLGELHSNTRTIQETFSEISSL